VIRGIAKLHDGRVAEKGQCVLYSRTHESLSGAEGSAIVFENALKSAAEGEKEGYGGVLSVLVMGGKPLDEPIAR
jgi:hypothetical protein